MTDLPDGTNAKLRAALTHDDALDDVKRARIWANLDARLDASVVGRRWRWPVAFAIAASAAAVLGIVMRHGPGDVRTLVAPAETTLDAPLGPYTHARLVGPAELDVLGPVGEATTVRLSTGTLYAQFDGGPGRSLRIVTAAATIDIVGTVFAVEVRDDDTCVSVSHGRVRATSTRGEWFVSTGEHRCSRDAAATPIDPRVKDALARHEAVIAATSVAPDAIATMSPPNDVTTNGALTTPPPATPPANASPATNSAVSPTPQRSNATTTASNVAATNGANTPPATTASSTTSASSTRRSTNGTAPSVSPSSNGTSAALSSNRSSSNPPAANGAPSASSAGSNTAASNTTASNTAASNTAASNTAGSNTAAPNTAAPSGASSNSGASSSTSGHAGVASSRANSATSGGATAPTSRAGGATIAPPTPIEPPLPPTPPTAPDLYRTAETALARHDLARADRALATLVTNMPTSPLVDQALYERARIAFSRRAWGDARRHLDALAALGASSLTEPGRYLACRVAIEAHDSSARRCLTDYRASYPKSPHDADVRAMLARLPQDPP